MSTSLLSATQLEKILAELGAVATAHDEIDPERALCALGESSCPLRFEEDELTARLRGLLAAATRQGTAFTVALAPLPAAAPAPLVAPEPNHPRGVTARARRLLHRHP